MSETGLTQPKQSVWPPEGALRIWYDRYLPIYKAEVPSATKGWLPPLVMGMSFEGLLAFMRGVPGPECSVMDAGAGISTWVLRKAFTNVVTVEPERTADIGHVVCRLCTKYGLLEHEFVLGLANAPECDYVLYDYETFPARVHELPLAWSKARIAMYLDDADDRARNTYLPIVRRFAEAEGAILTECRDAVDDFGRWGVWLHRENVLDKQHGTKRGSAHAGGDPSGEPAVEAGDGPDAGMG